MSQQNVEIIRAMHDEMSGQNLAAPEGSAEENRVQIEAVYAPDVELTWSVTNPESRMYRGYDGLIEAFSEWTGVFDEYYIDATDFIEVGDCVVVPTRQRGRGKQSGVPIDLDCVILYCLRDGRITRMREYNSLDEALEAARNGA